MSETLSANVLYDHPTPPYLDNDQSPEPPATPTTRLTPHHYKHPVSHIFLPKTSTRRQPTNQPTTYTPPTQHTMTTPSPSAKPPTNADKAPPSTSATTPAPPPYISSSGHLLSTPPPAARLSRLADSAYNFLGLYFVSLFSLDPYTAAQNSQFNTRGRPNAYQERARWSAGGGRVGGGGAGGRPSGGGAGGTGGTGGMGGGAAPGSGGRRMGTVDDVRGPECGSCG